MAEPRTEYDASLDRQLRAQGPMNLARAYETLERMQLDGLILAEPVNVFHLLGYWPQIALTRATQPPTTFALLSRDARQAPGLVTSRFIYYYTYVDGGFERDLQVHLYLEPGDASDDVDIAIDVQPSLEFADAERAPLSDIERRRRDKLDIAQALQGTRKDAGNALIRAIRGMGLQTGRVGYDHPLIAAICERHQLETKLVPADTALGWIRLVKSPLELQLMRRAAGANAEAVNRVARAIRAGATHAELRDAFARAAADVGNRSVFVTIVRIIKSKNRRRPNFFRRWSKPLSPLSWRLRTNRVRRRTAATGPTCRGGCAACMERDPRTPAPWFALLGYRHDR